MRILNASNAPAPLTYSALTAASRTVTKFTLAALATGAIPVPAASAAIVTENAAMIAVLTSELGVPVALKTMAESLGMAGTLNLLGRAVFDEAARAMGWFAGPAGVAGVSALGATTAGIQTWVVGRLAVEIAQNHGRPLGPAIARGTVRNATGSYREWRQNVLS